MRITASVIVCLSLLPSVDSFQGFHGRAAWRKGRAAAAAATATGDGGGGGGAGAAAEQPAKKVCDSISCPPPLPPSAVSSRMNVQFKNSDLDLRLRPERGISPSASSLLCCSLVGIFLDSGSPGFGFFWCLLPPLLCCSLVGVFLDPGFRESWLWFLLVPTPPPD